MSQKTRIEHDSLGEVAVPSDRLYGAQTQRAIDNFTISGQTMPRAFIHALGLIKASAARVNADLKQLEPAIARAIEAAANAVAEGQYNDHFPVDVFQTGSGTSSNMNANEVIANLASDAVGDTVHPNDHVNRGQSSNDVIPTAIHVSATLALEQDLIPALDHLQMTIERRAHELSSQVKTGRTHLMDAVPLTLGQELSGWATQIEQNRKRLESVLPHLKQLAQGGTAVGTGLNTHPDFAQQFASELSRRTGTSFTPAANFFSAIASQDTAVELSGQLRTLACSLLKIANDLRWMNSGPLTGLAEISLPALQPGSSIMPGKVNPVIPEAVAMACTQVYGNDTTIAMSGQSGQFQLNVMLPLIAFDLLQSIALLTNSASALADKAIAGFSVNQQHIDQYLARNPILVTALNDKIGYEQAAKIAKRAYREQRPIIDIAVDETGLSHETLTELLDPLCLTQPRA